MEAIAFMQIMRSLPPAAAVRSYLLSDGAPDGSTASIVLGRHGMRSDAPPGMPYLYVQVLLRCIAFNIYV